MRKILGIVIVCAVAASAMAMPARRGGVVRTAEDGTEKIVFLNGDETFHYLTDQEGNWLDEATLMPLSEETKTSTEKQGMARMQARRTALKQPGQKLLSPRGAIILVSFQDKAFKSSNADMTEWAMGENYTYNGATGSVRQYFLDQSWGQYDMQIDVFGPVLVSNNASYYGENDRQGNDKHAADLIVEACRLAHDSLGADFSQYDIDGDDYVDWVVILYAGYGEADGGSTSTIWPHQYDLHYYNKQFPLDGDTIDHYCCLNETDFDTKARCGIGTFCHEFSHVLGLPDFYSTNYSTHRTLHDWDVMDYGGYNNNGNTPPDYSAYERWFMGWMTPTLLNSACTVSLPPLCDSHSACLLTEDGSNVTDILDPNPNIFYLLENRKKEGWDAPLAGEGLMVTRVKYNAGRWEYNTVNNYANDMGMDIIEAKPNTKNRKSFDTDLYPAGSGQFTQITNYQVTHIQLDNHIITFDLNGGGQHITLDLDSIIVDDKPATKEFVNGTIVIKRYGKSYDITGKLL